MKSLVTFLVAYPQLPGIGIALLVGLARISWAPQDRRRNDWFIAFTALALPANLVCQAVTFSLNRLRPYKYDLYIWRLDGYLGQPSFTVGRWMSRQAPAILQYLANISYPFLCVAMLLVFAAYLWGASERDTRWLIRAFVVNLAASPLCYLLCPVCGPIFAFPHVAATGFPYSAHVAAIAPMAITASPNGMPSIHFSSALLIFWFARRWAWGVWLGGAYVVLMALATMGSGEHYACDLIAAVPYAALVLWVTKERKRDAKSLGHSFVSSTVRLSAREPGYDRQVEDARRG